MNYIQKNKTFAAREPNPLVRIWRLTGTYRMPLAGVWMQVDTAKLRPNPPTLRVTRQGGRRLCAAEPET